MYPDEPVVVVCEVDFAVGALPFRLLVAERMVVGQHVRESGGHNQAACWGMRDREPACAPKHERDARLEM